ncbi:MAG: hypothetical protein ACJ76I_03810 [Gaiellaceae bacterium]
MVRRSFRVAGAASIAAVALVAAGCGSSSSSSTSSTTTTATGSNNASLQAFQQCLSQHGVKGFTPGAGRPPAGASGGAGLTTAQRQAFTACRSLRPAGAGPGGGGGAGRNASNPAFAKYTACLKQHGVTLGQTNNQATFAKASAACAKYRPATTGGTAPQ